MSTDKTLADVQPGGRVRLGDQAERARFEEWYVQNAFDYEANPIGSRDCALMRKAWNAALAAQPSPGETLPPEMRLGSPDYLDYLDTEPSPGGQGDAPPCWWIDHGTYGQITQRQDEADAAANAGKRVVSYAARQPVGEPVSEKLMRLLRERAALPESVELSYQRDGDGTGRAWWDRRHAELEAQGYTLDFETDSGAEWYTLRGIGDELRAALAEYDAAPPAQAVDLGQFRKAVEAWKRDAENRHHAGDIFPEQEDAIWKEADRLLALIDAKAVGNG